MEGTAAAPLSCFRMGRNSSLEMVCIANAMDPTRAFGFFERPCPDSRARSPAEAISAHCRRMLRVHARIGAGKAEAGSCAKRLEASMGYQLLQIRGGLHRSNFYAAHILPRYQHELRTFSVYYTVFAE